VLTRQIYRITSVSPFAKDFGLRDQIRRASVSVMANIAEGFERARPKEFAHYLAIAKGSVGEVRCHLYIAQDLDYIGQDTLDCLGELIREIGAMLNALIGYLQKLENHGKAKKEN